MVLGTFLAPLWWLWYAVVYVYSHSWALAVSIAAVSSVYLAYRHRLENSAQSSRPKIARVVTKHSTLVQEVQQVLPVHPHNGWCLSSVSNGLRIFSRFFPSLGVSDAPCLAATTIINASPKKLLSNATNGRDIPCWLEGVAMAPQYIKQPRGTIHYDADVIQLSFEQKRVRHSVLSFVRHWGTKFTQKYATFLDGVFAIPTHFNTETFEREWHIDAEGRGQVCWVARQPSQLPYHWSMLIFSASTKDKSQSIATLAMLPKSADTQPLTSDLLTSQLTSLQDFSCLRRARVYSPSSSSFHPRDEVSSVPDVTDLRLPSGHSSGKESPAVLQHPASKPVKQVSKQAKQGSRNLVPNGSLPATVSLPPSHSANSHTQRPLTSTSSISTTYTPSPLSPLTLQTPPPLSPLTTHTSSPLPPPTTHTPSPPTSPLTSRYTKLGKESCDKLVQAAEATVKDGWIPVSSNKDLVIMKKPPKKGESSVNCIKGSGVINAPPEFVYRIMRNPENNCKLDDMLKETRVIDRVTGTTVLVHLLFKSVWPTAPRDFTVISTAGWYNEMTLVEAGVSVVDARLPEDKGYVRGNIVCGGYVIKVCPEKPEQCEVTYVSQAELKGNIPTFAVNKVTESQPHCISRLRALSEEQYAKLKNDTQKMKEFEESIILSPINPPSTNPPHLPLSDTDGGEFNVPCTVVSGRESGADGGGVFLTEIVDETRKEGDSERGRRERREEREGGAIEDEGAGVLQNGVESSSVEVADGKMAVEHRVRLGHNESWTMLTTPPPDSAAMESSGERQGGDGMLVMEALETFTPEEITSDEEGGREEGEGEKRLKGVSDTLQTVEGGGADDTEERLPGKEREEEGQIRFEKKLRPYQIAPGSPPAPTDSLTEDSIAFPRQESGGVDFRTLGNQTAARVLEELFHVSSLDIANPFLFDGGGSGWKVMDTEKGIVILKKKTPGTPFLSFMGKGVITLPPREVYDSLRNPQLRFTYDSMLKELHFVKHVEDGLYVLHIHHETTQCFIKQSRDFCILANERTEGNKLLLVGLSVDIPECPLNPNITRGKITYSGWVVEPHTVRGRTCSMITYLLQVDLGGIPATLVNYVSKRQPLAIAYLRDYLISTSVQSTSLD